MAEDCDSGGDERSDRVLEIGFLGDVRIYVGPRRRSRARIIGFTARWDMPMVGSKKFAYTKKGEEAAEKAAKKTGKQLKIAKKMKGAK